MVIEKTPNVALPHMAYFALYVTDCFDFVGKLQTIWSFCEKKMLHQGQGHYLLQMN